MSLEYREIVLPELSHIATEAQAQAWFWRVKGEGRAFSCWACGHDAAYEHRTRPEVKTCRQCGAQTRLRAGTALAKTRIPLLTIVRMVFLMMQDKRGASALSSISVI